MRYFGRRIDAREYWRQRPLAHQPVKRTRKLRMIAPHNQAAANSKQKIDFFTCPHTERLRTAHANRAVCAKSVDSQRSADDGCGFSAQKMHHQSAAEPQ